MSDITSTEPSAAASPRLTRGRKITIATLVTAGLATGGFVAAEGSFASGSGTAPAGSSASAQAKAPAPPAAPSANDLDGTVTAASSSSVTVRSQFGTSRTYKISGDTAVHRGRTKTTASALEVGQRVHVRGSKSGSTYTATDIDVRAAHIDGAVTAISGDTVTVTDNDGFTRSIALTSSTTYTKDGAKAARSDLETGSVVRAQGSVADDGTTLDASAVDIVTKETAPHGPGGGPAGGPGRGAPPAPGKGGPPAPGKNGSGKSGSGKNGSAPATPSAAPSGSSSTGS